MGFRFREVEHYSDDFLTLLIAANNATHSFGLAGMTKEWYKRMLFGMLPPKRPLWLKVYGLYHGKTMVAYATVTVNNAGLNELQGVPDGTVGIKVFVLPKYRKIGAGASLVNSISQLHPSCIWVSDPNDFNGASFSKKLGFLLHQTLYLSEGEFCKSLPVGKSNVRVVRTYLKSK